MFIAEVLAGEGKARTSYPIPFPRSGHPVGSYTQEIILG